MSRRVLGVVLSLLVELVGLLRRRWVVVVLVLLGLLLYYLFHHHPRTIDTCWDPPKCTGSSTSPT